MEVHEVRDIVKALKEEGLLLSSEKAWVPPHGNAALLSSSGTRPAMPSAIPRSNTWNLPMFKNRNRNERVETFTAQDAASGSNPTGYTGTAPKAGNLRVARLTRTWGEFYLGTNEVVAPHVGEYLDRADVDRTPQNGFDVSRNPFAPDIIGQAQNINSPMVKELWQFGNEAEKVVSIVDFQGNETLNNTQTHVGFISEYTGLDRIVKTGYADEVASVDADALDSRVVSINANLAGSHVATISDIYRTLKMKAVLAGKPDVRFGIAVNARMVYPLIDIWACNYQTARCSASDQTAGRVDLLRITELREQMNLGQYLLIDGETVPLIVSFGVAASYNSTDNEWTSDLFIVPLFDPSGGQGNLFEFGEAMTYREFFPMDNVSIEELNALGFRDYRYMNNGLYLMGRVLNNMGLSYIFASKMRLMCDYTWLCGRADDIQYTSSTPFGSPITTDADYKGGGDDAR